ncbi:Pre-mRNA-splicing factor SPF27 [Lipomyces oligophaga]|uniref:Pre-mRNA-splicing factor SPF27 n=1 Tax=Lipomyces oligophaga TaxID=45792 RepID=UPI0034CDE840
MAAKSQWDSRLHELHIAQEPPPGLRAQIEQEILEDLARHPPTTVHPLVPSYKQSSFSPLMVDAMNKLENGESLQGIDIDRYVSIDFDASDPLEQQEVVRKAYVALAYTQIRKENLDLLMLFGKNQWLRANDEIECDLRDLEKDVVEQQNEAALLARSEQGL